jgi:predicted nucleic acid-binding Zn ribbon protein
MPSETARRNQATPMKEAIESFLKSFDLKKQFNETYLVAFWEKIMGKYIASRTREISVKNRTLFLKIDSAPLRQELFMAKSKMIDMLNQEAGDKIVDEVVFL